MQEFYVIMLLTLICLMIYLSMYNLREHFGIYKRSVNGLYNGLTDNSDANWTLNDPERDQIVKILNMIIKKLNRENNSKLYLSGIDQVSSEKQGDGSVRYVVDFFVHNLNSKTTKRIIVVFIIHNNIVKVVTINYSNAMKYDEKSFSDYEHKNLILTDDNVGCSLNSTNHHIMGANEGSLEYSKFKSAGKKKVPTPTDFNKWILPKGTQTCSLDAVNNFPCRRQSKCWNSDGVHFTECESCDCFGIKSHGKQLESRPYENPTVNKLETEFADNHWLFDLSKGISSFPHGSSN